MTFIDLYIMVQYGTVRLVRCTEEEKYGTVRYGHLGSTVTPYS